MKRASALLFGILGLPLVLLLLPVVLAALLFDFGGLRATTRMKERLVASGLALDGVLVGKDPAGGWRGFGWTALPPEAWTWTMEEAPARTGSAPDFADAELAAQARTVLGALREPMAGRFAVTLDDPGSRKLEAVRAVREATGLGLKESKDLVDAPGTVVAPSLDAVGARVLVARLQALGRGSRPLKPRGAGRRTRRRPRR